MPSNTGSDASPRPCIGVTSADDPRPDNYVAAVEHCGGRVRVLANLLDEISAMLDELDGIVITGGSDIDPGHYGEQIHAMTKPGASERDTFELMLVHAATERGMPVLAVCRGMQIANVAWGGTLHQHIPDHVDGTVVHDDPARKFEAFAEHIVDVEAGSFLATTVGSLRFATNASHHQAVARVGDGLRVTARTQDGIIEALERPGSVAFWLATQWHPERLLDADEGRSRRIITAFIEAARKAQQVKKLPA